MKMNQLGRVNLYSDIIMSIYCPNILTFLKIIA